MLLLEDPGRLRVGIMRRGSFTGVLGLVLILLAAASAWCEDSRPLKPGEDLAYEKEYDAKKAVSVLRIYYKSAGGRTLVRQYESLECNAAQLTADHKLIFFILNLRDDKYDPYCLFVFDGRTGSDRKLFRATCGYAITPDARYICFERPSHRKIVPWRNGKGENALAIPVVVVVELATMKERSFDFVGTFLKDQWGSGVYIKYDTESTGFRLRFFAEDRTLSKGTIGLEDFTYHADKN